MSSSEAGKTKTKTTTTSHDDDDDEPSHCIYNDQGADSLLLFGIACMQCAASLDSLLALSPTQPSKTRKSKGTTIATVDNGSNHTPSSAANAIIISGAVTTTTSSTPDDVQVDGRTSSGPLHPSLASRRGSSSSTNTTTTLESLDFQSSASTTELTTTATTNTTTASEMKANTNITDTAEPAPAPAAAGSGKENAVNHSSSSNDGEIVMTMTGKDTTQSQKECSACHGLKCRAEYSASQWKKKKKGSNAGSKGSGRRCIDCIASTATCNAATTSTHAQTRAMMAAAVAIGTVGAVCASTGTASTHNASGAKNNNKKKGLAERNNNSGNSNSDSAQEDEEDDLEMADVDVDAADEVMAREDEDNEDENDNEEEDDDDDDDDDDALTLTNFDHANASLLTVEQSPAKQETVENNINACAAIEPIGVIHEEDTDVVGTCVEGPTPRATDGQVFAGFSPVTTTTSTTSSSTGTGATTVTVTANVNTNEQEEQEVQEVEDEALMSTYSFSLYEAEVSLEHIRSLLSTSSDDPANILKVATNALALPCFKASVLRDLTTASNKQTISGGESSPTPSAVCSPTVNSMASMFATHAAAMTSSPFASCAQDGFNSSPPSSAGSPLRLTGIDTRHLSDVYVQLQIVAAQSELALNDADAALTRMEFILRGVAIEPHDASSPIQVGTSGILELGLVLSDAYWVVGDASKADAVRQILTVHATQPTSSDEADMAATGSTTTSVENLAASLLKAMEPDDESEIELEPIVEAEEDVMSDDDKKATIPTITTTTKHVHFDTSSADEVSPRSPVADELNDISGRKIASSILKGGGYPEASEVEKKDLTIADDELSRPDVVQHLYHNYRSSFEFGKNNIPVGGVLLGLAESTASTSIKIASLGHLDLQAIDENFIGPHIVKGLDDVIANPAIETVGGIVDGIGGAVGAVISVLPFVGGGGRSEEEKEA